MGVFLHRLASLSFHARTDGGLHGFVVIAVGLEHKAFRAEDFRLEPRPQHLFGGHAMVGEKAAGGERCGTQNAHPANFFCADIRLQGKVNAHRYLEKKRSEGKHYNVAISHAAKKLVRLIFAMQRSGKAFLADY